MTEHSEMAQIVAKLEVVLAQQQEILEQQRQLYRQTEALFALYSQLTLNAALPTLRGYAISPDFAKILMMQLQAQQPRLIVELGGGMTEADKWGEILPAIQEAKILWLSSALERGRPIPEPTGRLTEIAS
jgi:hypothetical protein